MIRKIVTKSGQNFIAPQMFLAATPTPKFVHEQIFAHIHTAKN